MTEVPPSNPQQVWWTRPVLVLPLVGALIVAIAVLTPQPQQGRVGDSRLSAHLAGSLGGRVVADLAKRLGWRVVLRDDDGAPSKTDGLTIHAVLAPPIAITPAEAHAYLQAVRAGDGLLLALADNANPLSDSLHVIHSARNGILQSETESTRQCAETRDLIPPLWVDGRVHLWSVRFLRQPDTVVVLAKLSGDPEGTDAPGPAAAGIELGRGRVVVVADPDLLRNDVLRRCAWNADVIAVRMLEWLRAGAAQPRTALIFDEYHQGYGSRTSTFGVIVDFLGTHPVGRAILVSAIAALLLLMSAAPRALPPQHVERAERRDPLEQIDALAHAYEQVHATRTVASRLLNAMRWRMERIPAERRRSDAEFLDAITQRNPSLGPDVTTIQRALETATSDSDLAATGEALRRIEQTITQRR